MIRDVARRFEWALAGGVLLACASLLPFLGKAFSIDDPIFLREAERALWDPLHPTSISIVWGDAPTPVGPSSGPGMAWLLAPAAMAGGSEVIAHLTQLAGLLVAIWAAVALARRLGVSSGWAGAAGLLLSTAPAALGMAGTAMPDVWAMALGAVGLERAVAWNQDRRWHQAVVATLALAFAPLLRSHLLLVTGVGALLLAGDPFVDKGWWRERPWRWAPIAAAPVVAALVLFLTRIPGEGSHGLVGGTKLLLSRSMVPLNLVAFATNWALALPLTLPWAAIRWRQLLARWWMLVGGTAATAALLAISPWQPPGWWFALAPVAGLSMAVLWDVLHTGRSRRDMPMLALGVWLLVPLVAAPYSHLPAKYLLASAPAAAILVARELSVTGGAWPRWVLAVTCALGLVLGVAILRADERFAGLSRQAAATLIAPQVKAGHRVWFGGHWGFQWYAEKAGARILTTTPPYPQAGDIIVTSMRSDLSQGIEELLSGVLTPSYLGSIEDRSPGGRVMVAGSAGFFSNGVGLLPWIWSDEPVDSFDLWRMEKAR
jgi:hypothetical protein